MNRYRIGLYTDGVAAMKDFCERLNVNGEPTSPPVDYATVGIDLNGSAIRAGFGFCTLHWDWLWQGDFDYLLSFQGDADGTYVYARLPKTSGASGIDYGNFLGIAHRPSFETREGLKCYNVNLALVHLETA